MLNCVPNTPPHQLLLQMPCPKQAPRSRQTLRAAVSAPAATTHDVWQALPFAQETCCSHQEQVVDCPGPSSSVGSTSPSPPTSTTHSDCEPQLVSGSDNDEVASSVPAGGWLWDTAPGSMLRAAKRTSQRRLLRVPLVFGGVATDASSSPFAVAAAVGHGNEGPAFGAVLSKSEQAPGRTASAGPVLARTEGGQAILHGNALRSSPAKSESTHKKPHALSMVAAAVDALCATDPAPCFFAACLVRRLLCHSPSHAVLVQQLGVLPRLLTVLMSCPERAAALQVCTGFTKFFIMNGNTNDSYDQDL